MNAGEIKKILKTGRIQVDVNGNIWRKKKGELVARAEDPKQPKMVRVFFDQENHIVPAGRFKAVAKKEGLRRMVPGPTELYMNPTKPKAGPQRADHKKQTPVDPEALSDSEPIIQAIKSVAARQASLVVEGRLLQLAGKLEAEAEKIKHLQRRMIKTGLRLDQLEDQI